LSRNSTEKACETPIKKIRRLHAAKVLKNVRNFTKIVTASVPGSNAFLRLLTLP